MMPALIFDLDGTLFDNRGANTKSYEEAFKKMGLEFDANKYRKNFGLRFPEMMSELIPDVDDDVLKSIKKWKTKFYQNNVHLITPNRRLLLLAEESYKTRKTALVTTASRENVENLLAHFLPDKKLFHAIITGEDVSKGKPDPECYLLAFKALGMRPSECIIYEDSDLGIMAARRSGAKVIKVAM